MVFSKLTAVMGRRFTSNWSTPAMLDAAKASWAQAFSEEGITFEQARLATDRACKSDGFAPSLGEFLALCKPRPEDMGLPSERDAYLEACRNASQSAERKWSHPIVFAALQAVGSYELRTLPEKETLPRFKKIYAELVARALAGEVFPEPKAELPPPEKNYLAGAAARHKITQLRAILQ